jgi:phosphohistidine phosphatase
MAVQEDAVQIYLLRHGIAEDPQDGQKDSDRALTPEGRKRLRMVLTRAREAGVSPGVILTSPYLRARQTAQIAARTLGCTGGVLYTQSLTPMAEPEAAWEEIRLHKDHTQILCASHEPLCGRLTALLLNTPSLQVEFKKGALIRIDLERAQAHPRGILKWMLAPKLA